MSPHDRYIIDFARRWAPFGDIPSDEIFVNFGISTHAFFARLRNALHTSDACRSERDQIHRAPWFPSRID